MAAGSLWDLGQTPTGTGPASPPTTLQPVQPRLGPEPLEVLASLGVYAIGFFVLPLGREPIAMLEQRHRVRACLRARKRSGRSGWPHALYPPGRVRGLRGLRADLSGNGDLQRRHLGDRVPPAAPHRSVRSIRTTPSWRTSRPDSRPPPRRTRPHSSLDRVRSLRS